MWCLGRDHVTSDGCLGKIIGEVRKKLYALRTTASMGVTYLPIEANKPGTGENFIWEYLHEE